VNDDELERFRRLEAEAKVIHQTKEAEKARLREAQRKKEAEQQALIARQKALLEKKTGRASSAHDDDDEPAPPPKRGKRGGGLADLDVGKALDIARSAKGELEKPREKGEKSLLWSGGLSTVLGPVGWLYAGAWREAIPGAAAWLAVGAVASKILPAFMLWPVLMVVMPISGIAGLIYAWQFNRKGRRTRIFKGSGADEAKAAAKNKQLPASRQLPAAKRRR
jgi:hypothetical protein